MGYLQQELVELEAQTALLNKIGLAAVRRFPLIHRQENQGKLP